MNKRTRTAVIVIALLGVMALVNYVGETTPGDESMNESEVHAEAGDTAAGHAEAEEKELVPPPAPVGPADAPVRLEVLYEDDNGCHGGVSDSARNLAITYSPYIRLRLLPWNAEGTKERAEELDAHCMCVVALSNRRDDGNWSEAEVLHTGPPDTGGWSWGDVEGTVVTRLSDAGIEVSMSEMLQQAATDDGEDGSTDDTEAEEAAGDE